MLLAAATYNQHIYWLRKHVSAIAKVSFDDLYPFLLFPGCLTQTVASHPVIHLIVSQYCTFCMLKVHCVSAFGKLQEMIGHNGPFPHGLILHSWIGPAEMVDAFAKLQGVFFSLSGHLTRMSKKTYEPMVKRVRHCSQSWMMNAARRAVFDIRHLGYRICLKSRAGQTP